MFFLDRQGLIARLGRGPLTEVETFGYLIGYYVYYELPHLSSLGALNKPSRFNGLELWGLGVVAFVIMTGFGIYYLRAMYEANGGDRGRDFLSNLLSLQFVICCRLILPIYLLEGMTSAFQHFDFNDPSMSSLVVGGIAGIGGLCSVVFIPLYQFRMVRNSLREVALLRSLTTTAAADLEPR